MLKTNGINNDGDLKEVETNKHDKTIEVISEILSLDVSNYDEEIILKALISEFYHRNTNPEITEYILKGVYDNISSENSYKWNFFKKYLIDVYNEDAMPNNGFVDLEKQVLAKYYDDVEILEIVNPLLDILRSYEDNVEYKLHLDSENYVLLNPKENSVQLYRISLKSDNISWVNVINAYPQNIIIHDNPIVGRSFTISWKNKYTKKPILIEKKTISEMGSDLKETGWVLNKQRLDDTLSAIINISIIFELAIIRDTIEEDGFYYNEKEDNMIVNYALHEPTKEEVIEALRLIERLSEYFESSKHKLATGIKWGLVSIFSFARKQIGADFLPYLFLYGKAGSGKTTIGKIILYLWSYPSIDNNLEGSSFNTEFRIGEQLMQSSLPKLVNEPGGALKKRNVVEMLKASVQSMVSRSKQQGNKFVKKPAYAPVVFTANQKLPSDDGLIRRFVPIAFTHDEKKDKYSQRRFNEKFLIDNPRQSPLMKLHGLSNYIGQLICDNPELLKRDWVELGNYFIIKAYEFIGEKPPKWLLQYERMNSEEDNEYQEIEEIRSFLLNLINDKFNKKIQLKVYEEEWDYMYSEKKLDDFYSTNLAEMEDFKNKTFSVINQHLIPFMSLNKKKNGDLYVNFNTLLVKELFDNLEISSASNLKSISELLGWNYGFVTVNKEKGTRMYVEFETFLEFLYPNYEIVDENEI